MTASGKADLGLLEVQVTDEQTDPEIALDFTVDIAAGALSDLDAAASRSPSAAAPTST